MQKPCPFTSRGEGSRVCHHGWYLAAVLNTNVEPYLGFGPRLAFKTFPPSVRARAPIDEVRGQIDRSNIWALSSTLKLMSYAQNIPPLS